jgi:hypothetical protein
MHVNYGITVGLEIHKNWNNFNWKLPELLQDYLFLPKLKLYIERQVGNYYLRDGREGNFILWNATIRENHDICFVRVK